MKTQNELFLAIVACNQEITMDHLLFAAEQYAAAQANAAAAAQFYANAAMNAAGF